MGVCLSLKSIKFNVKEESSIMKADETKRKREILLGINPCIYGLNYHDPAVVVLIDGRVVLPQAQLFLDQTHTCRMVEIN